MVDQYDSSKFNRPHQLFSGLHEGLSYFICGVNSPNKYIPGCWTYKGCFLEFDCWSWAVGGVVSSSRRGQASSVKEGEVFMGYFTKAL